MHCFGALFRQLSALWVPRPDNTIHVEKLWCVKAFSFSFFWALRGHSVTLNVVVLIRASDGRSE